MVCSYHLLSSKLYAAMMCSRSMGDILSQNSLA
jgi:hypothetical protein